MKKLFLFSVTFIVLLAQDLRFYEFRVGTLKPKDSENGLFFAGSYGRLFDANLGYQFEIGYFRKNYRKEERVYDAVTQSTRVSTKFYETTDYIPIIGRFNLVRDIGKILLFKADLGIGYGLLWNKEENFLTRVSGSRFFSGFIWQLGADMGLQISKTGSVYGGIFYNGATLSGDFREIDGLPTYNEKNMSGLGYRITIRIEVY